MFGSGVGTISNVNRLVLLFPSQMASVSLPPLPHQLTFAPLSSSHFSHDRQNHIDNSTMSSLPNPPFVFPDLDPPSPILTMAMPHSPPQLPAFSFPQAVDNPSPSSSPRVIAQQRPGGHHRRGSEIISLDTPIASSPTKLENSPPSPPFLPTPNPGLSAKGPGRRGHAHRRSAAISGVDLSAISKAFPPKPLGGSAPSTPADIKQQHFFNEDIVKSSPFPVLSPETPPASPGGQHKLAEQVSRPVPWPVDRAPIFPRPLSTISSEDSVSTIRGNHSVTGSIASCATVLVGPGQPCARPKTAGAAFDHVHNSSNSSLEVVQQKRPLSASASIPKLNTNFSEVPHLPPCKRHLGDDDTASYASRNSQVEFSSDIHPQASDTGEAKPETSLDQQGSKKRKKVRSWAGILTRKAKRRSSKKPPPRKTPTPPPILSRTNSEIASLCEVNFDNDNTVVIRTPTTTGPLKPELNHAWSNDTLSLETSWKPRSFYEQGRECDVLSPVIDLDAALGPFNTPEMGSDNVISSGFSAATKRMYSGGRRGEFVGPEMRYHRRAESAPEMPPFDRSAIGMARFGGTSTLANPDVLYEEEEDAFLAGNEISKQEPDSAPRTHPSMNQDGAENESLGRSSSATVTREDSDIRDVPSNGAKLPMPVVNSVNSSDSPDTSVDDVPNSVADDHVASLREGIEASEDSNLDSAPKNSIEIVDADDWTVRSGRPTGSNLATHLDSCLVPSPKDVGCGHPQDASLQEGPHAYSDFPSPDPSSASFEVPRLATASSSITDRHTLHSTYSSEPAMGYFQGSVEDVPSLTSSASTMTGNIPNFSSPFYSNSSADRVGSISAATPRRSSAPSTYKRSSLSSLSKLVTGTSGQKSKLSYEEKAPGDETVKNKKKGNRMSRLIHFWRPKDKQKEIED